MTEHTDQPSSRVDRAAGTGASEDHEPATKEGRIRLLVVKVSLALILFGMVLTGRGNGIWPIITWPMYARLFEMPPPVISEPRIDIVKTNGEEASFMLREIAPIGEHNVVEDAMYCTEEEEDPAVRRQCARAIQALARWKVPAGQIAAIEMWEVQWNADALALPPLDRDAPDKERLIGTLAPRGTTTDSK